MKKQIAMIAMMASLVTTTAFAEGVKIDGSIKSAETKTILAPYSGVVDNYAVTAGDAVSMGDALFALRTEQIYADFDGTVTAVFAQPGDSAAILAEMQDYLQRRKDKQPLEWPSAGSTFKRPQGAFAGKLIEDCGLRGFTVGGAQISEKHCGFVINRGGATCADVVALTEQVRQVVEARTGFVLEREIRVVK